MTREIEAKFQVTSPQMFDQIRLQKEVAGHWLTDQKVVLQRDTYFDTPAGLLCRRGASLRLREKGEECLVTFKSKIKGNSVRTELEMRLTRLQAEDLLNGNLEEIDVEAVQTARAYLNGAEIHPVLHVENTREAWHINSEDSRIKICFDNVRYTNENPNRSASEYELELELKEGPETFLQEIAQALSQEYELTPNPLSKYERGITLVTEVAIAG
jgi:inorganic triphosphatase YgiF